MSHCQNLSRSLFLLGAFAVAAIPLRAQSLTGRVTDPAGNGLANIRIAPSNGAPSGLTTATGDFTITGLVNRTYGSVDIRPQTSQWAPRQFLNVVVSGATNMGTIVLQPGAAVSGTVVDPGGLPLFGVNMNAYDENGVKLFTPNDGTNLLGQFVITVPLGVIRIRAVPPTGTTLVPWERVYQITADINVGTIRLRQGFRVTGNVLDRVSNLPVAGVEFTSSNALNGETIVQLQPTTNAFGVFTLLLPFGLADLEVLPPAGNLHAPRQLFGIMTNRDLNIGTIRLDPAVAISGTVLGPGGPVAGCDIDVYTTDDYKLFSIRDKTNAAGVFQVMAPAGTYSLRLDPPVQAGLVGTRTAPASFAISTNVGTINLAAGIQVNLTILGPNGPEANADLDVLDPVTGTPVLIVGDHAGPNGALTTYVPAGTWDFAIDARQGSLGAPLRVTGVAVTSPITTTYVLAQKQIMADLTTFGVPTIGQGGYLPVNFSFHNTTPNFLPVWIDTAVQFSSGMEIPIFPPIQVPIIPQLPLTLGGVWMPTPPVPAAQVGRLIKMVVRFRDPATNLVLDEAHTEFVVQ